MADHTWVAMSYTPITVELAYDGSLTTYTNEAADEIARDESLLGCWFCHTPLTVENFGTECISGFSPDRLDMPEGRS